MRCSRVFWTAERDDLGVLKVMRASSAYRPNFCSTINLMVCASGSITMAKIKGESGHPCLVPLVIIKGSDVMPDIQTRALGEEYIFRMADRIVPDKPNLPSKVSKYVQ